MKLLLDLGNTRLKCALADAEGGSELAHPGLVQSRRVRHGSELASAASTTCVLDARARRPWRAEPLTCSEVPGRHDEVVAFAHGEAAFLAQFSAWLRANVPPEIPAWMAAVAPDARVARVDAALKAHGIEARRVLPQARALGLRLAYAEPARFGVDRWLAMLAARAHSAGSVLVASIGSALTIDAILAEGRHLGGLIAPAPEAMRTALVTRLPGLNVNSGSVQRFAASTEDAVASGSVLAAAALIERSWAELARTATGTPSLWVCGGGAAPLRAWLPTHEFVPSLVLEGLALWTEVCVSR